MLVPSERYRKTNAYVPEKSLMLMSRSRCEAVSWAVGKGAEEFPNDVLNSVSVHIPIRRT